MAEIWPKPTLFDFGPSLNKDNMAKIFKRVFFSENIYNSPLFRKNIREEQKKWVFTFFGKYDGF
jgi:hypothetical protein